MSERDELLGEIRDYQETSGNLSLKTMLLALLLLFGMLGLFVPKIYLRSHIYYTSRHIIQLQNQADSLAEENKHLKKQLEDMKFKFLILDIGF